MIEGIFLGLLGVNLGMAVFGTVKLHYALTHFRMKPLSMTPSILKDLPAVSICVPARNEMAVMSECLESLLASTYPKLEIIVLDDSSADNTSALIKAYASEGVRFVEGSPLPDGWLGKNHALQELSREASGDYILFIDVDTRLAPGTIKELVMYAEQEHVAMVSVLPRREDDWRWSVMFGTLRYYWQLLFHRVDAPAVASNGWMIDRDTLVSLGGFEPFKGIIQPEARLSSNLMKAGEYRFLIGTSSLGMTYEKKWHSQVSTSIRLMFPLLGGRVHRALLGLIGLLVLLVPFAGVVSGFIVGWSLLQGAAGLILFAFIVLYGVFLRQTRTHTWWLGALLWPLTVIQEMVLLVTSTERYLRHRVVWKGRPVSNTDRTVL